MKRLLLSILSLILFNISAKAQCAMCKTTIVNNVSHGEISLAEGLNFGIMYLFVTPYLAILALGILWFIKSKKHGKKKIERSTIGL